MDYPKIVSTMRSLALAAGAAILEVRGRPDFEVRAKSDNSPVTEADEAADVLIRTGLRAAFPDIPVVTEEERSSHVPAGATFFLVDPLDGTKEFVRGAGDFTVNIALVENGVPTRGVVLAPAVGRLFYTLADGSAVEDTRPDDPEGEGALRTIRVAQADPAGLAVVASKSHRDKATDDYIRSRTGTRRRTTTSRGTRCGRSVLPVPRSSSAWSRRARPISTPGSGGRWNGTPPRVMRSFAPPVAAWCASTIWSR